MELVRLFLRTSQPYKFLTYRLSGIYKIFTGVQYPFNLNQNPLAADHIGYTANLTTDPFNLETYHVAPTGNTCNVSNIVMDIFRNFEFLSCVDLSS
jgi:hypothetical protein